MIDSHALKSWPFKDAVQSYDEKDTILYALSVGYGADPLDEKQLRFVYEKDLLAVPTMAVVLSYPGLYISDPRLGIDWLKVVHGEQAVRFHRALPPSGTVAGLTKVVSVTDKGAGKGAIFVQRRTLRDAATDEPLATLEQVNFCRGDGGYSIGSGTDGLQVSDPPPAPPHAVPESAPDLVDEIGTSPQQALIYRLCADRHPIHVDPKAAAAAGFPRPILHGLGSYGIVGHSLLRTCCDYDPAHLKYLRVRFAAPFIPGETLVTEIWRSGSEISFRSRSKERGVVVLNHGFAEVAA